MAHWLLIHNGEPVLTDDIPLISIQELCADAANVVKDGMRPVQFYGRPSLHGDEIIVTAIVADDLNRMLFISKAELPPGGSYGAITAHAPSFHLFEREIYEQTGIAPRGHPWLKPVRYGSERKGLAGELHGYPYLKIDGRETHEVAVGPVHAGVIEPGSFRFLCHGERVFHLEIQLGYQHRGVEKLFLQGDPLTKAHLAESITGDTAVGHTWAYALCMEGLSANGDVPKRAQLVRAVGLELERIAMHLAGLAGIALDIGYLPGASVYGRIRTAVINTSLKLCGSRFGRGLVRPGGVLFDINDALAEEIVKTIETVNDDVEMVSNLFFDNPSVLSRLEQTGMVSAEDARAVGLVGTAAKMAGIAMDSRASHPIGIYKDEIVTPHVLPTGDVFARAKLRVLEIRQSIQLIHRWLHSAHVQGEIREPLMKLEPDCTVISIIEGWRGEVSHVAVTDKKGHLHHYKVKDPSFHNWMGLALAVRDNGISDFPLCNKSFDQSYCGFDL